jgi:hypothetical protein
MKDKKRRYEMISFSKGYWNLSKELREVADFHIIGIYRKHISRYTHVWVFEIIGIDLRIYFSC